MLPNLTIGLDLGDRKSVLCEIDATGEEVRRGVIPTTRKGVREYFSGRERCRVVLEAGTHSPWVSRELKTLGHEVVVGNPALMHVRGRRKNDRRDAEHLGRQGRADVRLLHPIEHRRKETQQHLALIRGRDVLTRCRSKLINHVRGSVKSYGERVRSCSAEAFARYARDEVPEALRPALLPLVEVIADLTERIRTQDKEVERLAETTYGEAARLQQVKGVGALTALAYMLIVDDPGRFKRSRDAGPYFGLVPRLDDSSDSTPQLRISKAGDELGRRLLVSAAQYILGPFGPPCDLRRHGERIAARGGKNAKKRAAVAVARKLAVLLHHLWVKGETYDPDWLLKQRQG
jgi:transposase